MKSLIRGDKIMTILSNNLKFLNAAKGSNR